MKWFSTNRYGKKKKFLGEGVTGYVYLYQTKTQSFAVKTYKSAGKHETSAEYKERASNEYKILRQLSHPCVETVHQLVNADSRKAKLVMDYYPNSARELILGMRREKTRLQIFGQLVDGVRYLHANRIAHRDLKMDNLLVDTAGNLKIIDFGDSTHDKDECVGIVGTQSYVAPEVYNSFRYNPFKSDCWSLGIILHFFLFFQLPWKLAKANEDLLFQKYSETGRLPSSDGGSDGDEMDDFHDILLKLLSINIANRIDIDSLYVQFTALNLD